MAVRVDDAAFLVTFGGFSCHDVRVITSHELRDADFIVGSKAMKGANDRRPVFRRAATKVINGMLRVALDFRGTDTHGLKAFHRETVLPVVEACVIDRDLFASEMVIRAGRAGVSIIEIPIQLSEKRPPAINLTSRVPHVLKGLAKLTYAILFGALVMSSRASGAGRGLSINSLIGMVSIALVVALLPEYLSRGFGIGLNGVRFDPLPTAIYLIGGFASGVVFSLSEAKCLSRSHASALQQSSGD